MRYEFSPSVRADIVRLEDHAVTGHMIAGAVVGPRRAEDGVFEHAVEPLGEYVVELTGEIIAACGFLLHYITTGRSRTCTWKFGRIAASGASGAFFCRN